MFKVSSLVLALLAALFGYDAVQKINADKDDAVDSKPVIQQPDISNPTSDLDSDAANDPKKIAPYPATPIALPSTAIGLPKDNSQTANSDNWGNDFSDCPNVMVNQDSSFTPYLQSQTDSSVWVSWKSEKNQGSIVEYSTSPCAFANNDTQIAQGSAQFMTFMHYYNTVKLEGLEEDQRYYYRVKTGNKISGIHRFKTAPKLGDDRKVRFLAFGDHQSPLDSRYKMLVQAAKNKVEQKYGQPIEQSIDFVINQGDQVQNGGLAVEWENLHFRQSAPISANLPIQMTVGNHEYWGDPNLNRYRAFAKVEDLGYAGIPSAPDETYYAHQQGSTLLIHLNSNVDSHKRAKKSQAAQTAWLQQVIDTAKNDDSVSFIVSVLHHPYRTEADLKPSKSMNDTWMGMLTATEKYAMTISGHHHLYTRGQVTEKPVYHVISGGTGGALSTQWFGKVGQKYINNDEVQKTIANWTWQIIEIDPVEETLTVETYAESHPAIFRKKRKMTFNSRLIDSFTRKLGQIAPEKPMITDLAPYQTVDLSTAHVFSSSEFSSSLDEALLNTTQFQISSSADFSDLSVNKLTHYEDVFGDSGAPNYTPIDLNAGVDIQKMSIAEDSLSNGTHFIRVRHRDRNVEWSAWSDPVAFNVVNSTGENTVDNLQLNMSEQASAGEHSHGGGESHSHN